MATDRDERPPIQAPLSGLERSIIDEFVRMRGYDPAHLEKLSEEERDALLKDASIHASARLAEIESRAHYVHELHDGTQGSAKNGRD